MTESMSILGIGAVTPLGRSIDAIKQKLRAPAVSAAGSMWAVDDLPPDPVVNKRMRRADRFSKMATIAAGDAWNDARAQLESIPPERIGMIVSTGFGPHVRGFKFLDGILDCGDSAALPTDFSHSVHGAAAAYIAEILGIRGPSLTCTDFETGFEHALKLAQCLLSEGACDRVLLGAVEELGVVMEHCARRIIDDKSIIPSEGAVFVVLGPAELVGRAMLTPSPATRSASSHRNHFGHNASGAAFDLLGSLLAPSIDNDIVGRSSSDSPSWHLVPT